MGNIHDCKDDRNIEIDNVGVCNYKLPLTFSSRERYNSVGEITCGVRLSSSVKGAHLSRIVEVLDQMVPNNELTITYFDKILMELSNRLELKNANLNVAFPIVYSKITPVSNRTTYLNSDIVLSGQIIDNVIDKQISLTANGAMLCPNSKSISKYGAHSQKCKLKATLYGSIENIIVEELLQILGNQFSAEVYGIVKSVDEKLLTEKAYDNPKFSEDLVRDTLIAIKNYYKGGMIEAQIENLESIHQHNVYARGLVR